MKSKNSLRTASLALTLTGLISASCDSLLDVDLPTTTVLQESVFTDEITATSAVKGIYADMISTNGFVSGGNASVAYISGLSADELTNVNAQPDFTNFENNTINPRNDIVLSIWSTTYKTIYEANAVIEGLSASGSTIPEITKNQLLGEALFLRAFAHFYLVNLFGNIPLILTTDYNINAKTTRTTTVEVQDRIVSDLLRSASLIGEAYTGIERQRVNKGAVQALLARVYLYREQWENASALASEVISKSLYILEPQLDKVFLATSREAIWQLAYPTSLAVTTYEGQTFIIQSLNDVTNVLSDEFLNALEANDARHASWIGTFSISPEKTVHFPYKYKLKYGSVQPTPLTEHSTILRLAEQYLIRAEAYAHQDKLTESMRDLDTIRSRANLPLISNTSPALSKEELLQSIQHERQIELFTEGAHRWFDLKRTGEALIVLQAIKPGISKDDLLFPIPQTELNTNSVLGNQNPGY